MGKAKMHGMSEKEEKPWGQGKFANMPTEVEMDEYPSAIQYGPTVQNDTMTRIDEENRRSDGRARSHMSNQH
jgi:hypothetical protein